jgi:hypothetical protein
MTTRLPPQGPPEPDEKLPGEAELAKLYRQLPQNEPDPALDAAVLRAAAQALASDEEGPAVPHERGHRRHPKPHTSSPAQPSSAEGSRRPRRLIALGSAATLVLAAGLAWHMRAWPPTGSAPAPADSAAPVQAAAPAPRIAPEGAPMPPLEPAASTPPMPAMQQPLPEMIAAKSPTSNVTTLREAAANKHIARTSGEGYAVSALRRAAPADPATAASPMIAPQAASDSTANAVRPTLQEAAPGALRMRGRMPVAPTPIGPFTGTDTASNASDTPAQELDKIRHLFALGRDDEARQRLTAFHLAHPRWDLPLDLQPRLSKP